MIMAILDKLGTAIFLAMVVLVILSTFLPKPKEFEKLTGKKKLLLIIPFTSKKNIISDSDYRIIKRIILIDNAAVLLAVTGILLLLLQSMVLKSEWYLNHLLGK